MPVEGVVAGGWRAYVKAAQAQPAASRLKCGVRRGCFGAPLLLLFRAVGDRLGAARIYPPLSQVSLLSSTIVSGS